MLEILDDEDPAGRSGGGFSHMHLPNENGSALSRSAPFGGSGWDRPSVQSRSA
jgi:hypothetical protein